MTAVGPRTARSEAPERSVQSGGRHREVSLAAADVLWDRMAVAARVQGETAPAVDELLTWCEADLGSVFPVAEEAELARRAVKVMALASLLPGSRTISPREMTHVLGTPSSCPAVVPDVRVVAGVMRRMQSHCPAIWRQRSADVDELDEQFSIGGCPDPGAELDEQAPRLAGELASRPEDLARTVIGLCDDPRLPLARLARGPRTRHTVQWQGTERHGFVSLVGPGPLSLSAVRDLSTLLDTTEADYLVVVVAPEFGSGPERPADVPLMPILGELSAEPADRASGAAPVPPIVVWSPRSVADRGALALAAARWILASRLSPGPGASASGAPATRSSWLDPERARVAECLVESYALGRVEGPAGLPDLAAGAGTMTFDAWLEGIAMAVLEHRFPRHFLVSPGRARVTSHSVAGLVEVFLRAGCTGPGAPLPFPVQQLVEGFLSPAGLVDRKGRGWTLNVDPARSDATRYILETAGHEPVATEELYWRLRKGPLGLSRPCFDVLLVTLVFSGHLVALSRSRRLPLVRVTGERLDRVSQVVRERPLDPEVARALLGLRFLFVRRRRTVPGSQLPRPLWNDILLLRAASALRLAGLRAALKHARAEPAFSMLDADEAEAWLGQLGEILGELDMWGDPHEGLTHLHRRMSDEQLLEPLDRVQRLLVFLEQSGAAFLTMSAYLAQEELRVAPGPRFGPLSLELDRLRARARQRETCLSRDALVAFERDLMTFKETFREIYTADHAAHAACSRLDPSRLETRATCACGHQLGDAGRTADVPVRDLAVLSRGLAGRVVSRGQVFEAVAEWLGRDGDDSMLVRIHARSSP